MRTGPLALLPLLLPAWGASCRPEPPPDCAGPGVLCPLAGDGQLGYNGQGLPALETWLFYPSAARRSPEGALVVMDFNNFLVRVLAEDGTLQTLAGTNQHAYAVEGPALESPLENPVDFSFSPEGWLTIAELHSGRVLQVDDAGWLRVLAGTGELGYSGDGGPATEATFGEINGLDYGPDGTLYIADTGNHAIRALHPDGTLSTLAGDGTAGWVDGPLAEARFHGPQRIRWADGALWVADAFNHAIRRVDPAGGQVRTVAGTGAEGFGGDGGPATAAALRYPYGVTAHDGRVLIADSGNHVLREVDAEGVIHTVVGTGNAGYDPTPTLALAADLYWPADVWVDDDGAWILADMRNGVVRRLAP